MIKLKAPAKMNALLENSTEAPCLLITGGTSGIGLAIAEGFAEAGYKVLAVGVGDIPPSTKTIDFQSLDVRDNTSIKECVNRCGRLDVLINAAGAIRRHEELKPEIFEAIVDINLNGTMRLCAASRDLLANSKGCIINIASMLSYFGGGVVPGYSASKGGVAQLTKSLAIAYAADGIRVNALAPGWIATPMTSDLRAGEERNQAIIDRTPLRRWGEPSELIGPGLFSKSRIVSDL